MSGHKDLLVWQKSMELVEEIYRIVKLLPKEERFALGDQMRRAVISIPSNLAEGQGRNYNKEFLRFIMIAQGSRAELETQLDICIRLGLIRAEQAQTAYALCNEVGKMLRGLFDKLNNTD